MTTNTHAEPAHSPHTDDLPATAIFSLLADDRRRGVLHYLTQHVGAVSLGELAEQLAVHENDPTYDNYERVLTDLHHSHLPKLVDADLVHYDVDAETIRPGDAIESVRPYLELALEDDLRGRDGTPLEPE